jgi:hypothetical protein
MSAMADIRAYIDEAQTCIEAALVACEMVAGHGIVGSRDFDNAVEQMRLALEALDKARLPDNVVRLPNSGRI